MEAKIVCIGDSLTYGYGLEADQCWIGILKNKYKLNILNAGINGDTTAGMLARFDYHVVRAKPEYVVIMGGANDLIQERPLDHIKMDMIEMIRSSEDNGIIPIIGLQPHPPSEDVPMEWKAFTDYDAVAKNTFAFRNWLLSYCPMNAIKYIDFGEGMKSRLKGRYRQYFMDGVHPDASGHRIMAHIAEDIFVKNGIIPSDNEK